MATAPPTGVMVPPPGMGRMRLGGAPYTRFNIQGLQPYLNALMGRWGDVMDIQTERLRGQADFDPRARQEWLEKRQFEREMEQYGAAQGAEAQRFSQDAQMRAEKAAKDAALKKDMEKRAAMMADIERARGLSGYQPFTPAGSVADFYSSGSGGLGGFWG
ncbi:MAG: hypothetical protein AAB368_03500 [bacterium]